MFLCAGHDLGGVVTVTLFTYQCKCMTTKNALANLIYSNLVFYLTSIYLVTCFWFFFLIIYLSQTFFQRKGFMNSKRNQDKLQILKLTNPYTAAKDYFSYLLRNCTRLRSMMAKIYFYVSLFWGKISYSFFWFNKIYNFIIKISCIWLTSYVSSEKQVINLMCWWKDHTFQVVAIKI